MKGALGMLAICAVVWIFWMTTVAVLRTRKKKRRQGMIVVIYLIIALSLCFTICFAHKEHITNRKLEGKYYTEEWISSRYFLDSIINVNIPNNTTSFYLINIIIKNLQTKN